jgi:hypothetical protein
VAAQGALPRVAPQAGFTFEHLREPKGRVVFRDVTPALRVLDVVPREGSTLVPAAVRALVRGRRWGKSVLGDMWLAFMRGRSDLFAGTWAEHRMLEEKFIGVKLTLSSLNSHGAAVVHIAEQINDGLAAAELVDGFGAVAKGRRVSVASWADNGNPVKWTDAECVVLYRLLFAQLKAISASAGRRVALLIDEYDGLVLGTLTQGAQLSYDSTSRFCADFFTFLKQQCENNVVPYQFIVGSSRLAIQSFWSGGNIVRDVSLDADAAAVLGYTWAEIEGLYEEQLALLERRHGLDRAALRRKIEQWYNGHRWSPESTQLVYNPYCVQELMRTGVFKAFWAATGVSSLLLRSGLFVSQLVRAVMSKPVTISYEMLRGSTVVDMLTAGKHELSAQAQLSVLASAGVLSVDPSFQLESGELKDSAPVPLVVPNEDALAMAIKVLRTAVPSGLGLAAAAVNECLLEDDLLALFGGESARQAIAEGLKFFAGVRGDGGVTETDADARHSEFRVSLSVSSAMFLLRGELVAEYRAEEACPQVDLEQLKQQAGAIVAGDIAYPSLSPVEKQQRGRPWSVDHLFVVPRAGRPSVAHIVEFKVARDRPLLPLLADALEQSIKYQLVDVNGAELRFSAFVFDDSGKLVAGAQPRSLVDAVRLVHKLRSDRSADDVFLAVRHALGRPVHACSPVCGAQ